MISIKRIGIFLLMVFAVLFTTAQNQETLKFYVGTFTSEGAEGIYLCGFNEGTQEINLLNTFKGIDDPSFLKISPDENYLYVVTRANRAVEPSGGFVVAYKISDDGSIQFINKQVANGADPCHVDVSADGKFVAIATYGGGTTSLYPVNSDGSLQPASSVIVNAGSGPDKARQEKPHAHSIKFSPFGNQVFSADLGTDQLNIYYLENKKLVQHGQEFMKLAPGSGPRHFDFYPGEKIIYVISELKSTITSFVLKDEKWTEFQTVSALPKNFDGESYCADIHISSDGRFLYGSNRGHNSIAVFKIDDSKKLTNVGFVSVEGNWPRNFTLTPDGKYMLVANQKSGNITVFKIDENTGMPKYTGNEIKLPSPVCLEFLKPRIN